MIVVFGPPFFEMTAFAYLRSAIGAPSILVPLRNGNSLSV